MLKVTLIFPVYNVEKYLKECLDSVERQTYTDFECLLVDDGSTDQSGKMCDEYAANHPNTRVIHKENGGLSDARNTGVKEAKYDYIVFMDSDDYVSDDYIEYLVKLAEDNNADVAIAGMKKYADGTVPTVKNDEDKVTVASVETALSKMCYGEYVICAPSKIYKKELLERYPFPKGKYYEDVATTYKIVGDSSVVVNGNKEIYFWRQRAGSITRSKINEGHLYGLTACQELLAYMEKNYPSVIPAAQIRYANKIIDTAYRAVISNKDKELFERIRVEIFPIYKDVLNNKTSFTVRLRTRCLKLGYLPFLAVCKLYSLIKG